MTNATIAFNRLVEARNAEGVGHAVTAAQNLANTYYPGRTFDAAPVVNRFFTTLDEGDRTGAEEVLNEALAALNQPEPTPEVASDADVAEDTTGLEARVAALETIARQNGITLAVPAGVGTLNQRVTALENAARNNGLL